MFNSLDDLKNYPVIGETREILEGAGEEIKQVLENVDLNSVRLKYPLKDRTDFAYFDCDDSQTLRINARGSPNSLVGYIKTIYVDSSSGLAVLSYCLGKRGEFNGSENPTGFQILELKREIDDGLERRVFYSKEFDLIEVFEG